MSPYTLSISSPSHLTSRMRPKFIKIYSNFGSSPRRYMASKYKVINEADLNKFLAGSSKGWTVSPSVSKPVSLSRTFHFQYFKHAWAFMAGIASRCEQERHHPEWSNVYNTCFVKWTTHYTGALTDKDLLMAEFCDQVAQDIGEKMPVDQDPAKLENMKSLADESARDGCKSCAPT
jgi:4a-hydroxytetrahydrobiopterin dehydratase